MSHFQLEPAPSPIATFVFAHGAGAGQRSEFMDDMTTRLIERQISVVRFEFDYMARRAIDGKKRPPAPVMA